MRVGPRDVAQPQLFAPGVVEEPGPLLDPQRLGPPLPRPTSSDAGVWTRGRGFLGMDDAAQLARVPENLLSSIRGIGRDTAREIQDARRHLLAAPGLAAVEEPEFSPGFRGEDTDLEATKLTEALRRRLEDAGLHDLAALLEGKRQKARVGLREAQSDGFQLRAVLPVGNKVGDMHSSSRVPGSLPELHQPQK